MANAMTTVDAKITDRYTVGGADGLVLDVKLFKAIGLDQLLRPRVIGSVIDRCRTLYLFALCLSMGMEITQLARQFIAPGDLQNFLLTTSLAVYSLMIEFKGFMFVTNADRLRDIIDVTSYGFTASSRRDPTLLLRCRDAFRPWLRAFVIVSVISGSTWIISPLFMDEYVPFNKPDGTVGCYRQTMFNMWFPISERTHNRTPVWIAFYVTEMVVIVSNMVSWMLFDCYVMTVCTMLGAQFRTLAASYETLGHRLRNSHPRDADFLTSIDDYHDELARHVKDNQKIIKKFDDLLNFIRPMVILQITNGTYTVIANITLAITVYLMGSSVLSLPFQKHLFGFILTLIQLYIYCYSLNYLEVEKTSVNFGLYSCNWTEMNLTFKKAILRVMVMNSAHKGVLKISPKSIINLEMFAGVLKSSFSIVSVLLKVGAEKISGK